VALAIHPPLMEVGVFWLFRINIINLIMKKKTPISKKTPTTTPKKTKKIPAVEPITPIVPDETENITSETPHQLTLIIVVFSTIVYPWIKEERLEENEQKKQAVAFLEKKLIALKIHCEKCEQIVNGKEEEDFNALEKFYNYEINSANNPLYSEELINYSLMFAKIKEVVAKGKDVFATLRKDNEDAYQREAIEAWQPKINAAREIKVGAIMEEIEKQEKELIEKEDEVKVIENRLSGSELKPARDKYTVFFFSQGALELTVKEANKKVEEFEDYFASKNPEETTEDEKKILKIGGKTLTEIISISDKTNDSQKDWKKDNYDTKITEYDTKITEYDTKITELIKKITSEEWQDKGIAEAKDEVIKAIEQVTAGEVEKNEEGTLAKIVKWFKQQIAALISEMFDNSYEKAVDSLKKNILDEIDEQQKEDKIKIDLTKHFNDKKIGSMNLDTIRDTREQQGKSESETLIASLFEKIDNAVIEERLKQSAKENATANFINLFAEKNDNFVREFFQKFLKTEIPESETNVETFLKTNAPKIFANLNTPEEITS
ncbi:26821_t:CDS:2, partial [Racocetra persica]